MEICRCPIRPPCRPPQWRVRCPRHHRPLPVVTQNPCRGVPPWRFARCDARDRSDPERQRAAGARLRHLGTYSDPRSRPISALGCPNCAGRGSWRAAMWIRSTAARSGRKTTVSGAASRRGSGIQPRRAQGPARQARRGGDAIRLCQARHRYARDGICRDPRKSRPRGRREGVVPASRSAPRSRIM